MRSSLHPLCVCACVTSHHTTEFYKHDEVVTVRAPGSLMRQLIRLCDGSRSIENILSIVGQEWDVEDVQGLLDELHSRKVFTDAVNASNALWKIVENPSRLSPALTDAEVEQLQQKAQRRHNEDVTEELFSVSRTAYHSLVQQRRSRREFSGEAIATQHIVDIAWSAYGLKQNGGRATPSAGVLYPLIIHLVLIQGTDELQPGIYKLYLGAPDQVGFSIISYDIPSAIRAYIDPTMAESAAGIFVISGAFKASGEKYGNRSLLYVPLEAGHVAQNAQIAATEKTLAVVEIGGFTDSLLADALQLESDFHPLTSVMFGCASDSGNSRSTQEETDWAVPVVGTYRPPIAIALARLSPKINTDWSQGRDAWPSRARTKAISEAREWAACGCVSSNLRRARYSQLSSGVDPRNMLRFHPAQYRIKQFPFAPFNPAGLYEWVKGREELTGRERFVLADLVYFPYFPGRASYGFANSSGVAAHPERQMAVELGVLELIERDAFMNAYFAQLSLPVIRHNSLPSNVRVRVENLTYQGFEVWVLDCTLDLAPVVLILVQSEHLHFTTCAACTRFDVVQAMVHALAEVEAAVLARLQNGPSKAIAPSKVAMPHDHGALYEQKQYYRRADFLARSGRYVDFSAVGKHVAHDWEELQSTFASKGWQLITVPLHIPDEYGGNDGLHIVRSIVPGMVPMTFGYREEPAGMDRLYSMAMEREGRWLKYRDLTKFPHPFA